MRDNAVGKAGPLKQKKNLAVTAHFEELARPRASTAVDQRIGRRLREARVARDLSLIDLAGLAQIAPQQLQKYETARTRVSASRLYQLAQILNRPVFWFFEED
jgi:ribosome-binding protein aMBF1 (putative translation factor)